MIRVAHLTDDPGMGGVNRFIDALLPRLEPGFVHERHCVIPAGSIPPVLEADVVVIHFTTSWRKLPWLYALRARNHDTAFIFVEHSYTRAFEALHVLNKQRFRKLLNLTYRMMDRVVAVSPQQAAWIEEAVSLPSWKLAAISPMTELASLRALPLATRKAGPLRLGAYGRYAPQKGFDILIEAMRRVPPSCATLRLGGMGPDEAILKALAADLPHVQVEGTISDPASFLNRVDAVVVPSRFEAFGLVAAEARAAGRPIIVSGVDGLLDQRQYPSEMTVPPEDPDALAQAIIWLAERDLTRLGEEARASVQDTEFLAVLAWNFLLGAVAQRQAQAA